MSVFTIESKRLELRELTLEDTAPLFDILSDEETMKFYPAPYTLDQTEGWIKRSIQSYQDNGFGLWAVLLKENQQFLGQCGISRLNIDGAMVPEIGYQIHKTYWNQGFATEAAAACLPYGFEQKGLEEIFIHTYVKNKPSQRVAEKLKMTLRKEFDKKIVHFNITMKHVVYSMTHSEYQALSHS